jgi:O-antigen/teichoic acid export membrane protein
MGASGQGFWAHFRSILDFMAVVAAYGFPMAFPFLVNVKKIPARGLFRFTIGYGAVAAPLLAGVLFFAWRSGFVRLASSTPVIEIAFLATTAAAMTTYAMLRGLVLATGPTSSFNLVTAAAPVSLLLLVVVMPIPQTSMLLWISAGGAVLALIITIAFWWHSRPEVDAGASEPMPLRDLAVFGGWNFLVSASAAAVPMMTIQWLRAGGVSSAQIGCFSVAVLVQGALLMPANMAGPLVYNSWSQEVRPDRVMRGYTTLLRYGLVVSVAGAVCCGLVLQGLLPVAVGEGFDDAVVPAFWLLAAVPFGYWTRLIANVLLAAGHARAYASSALLRMAITALALWLTEPLTIAGAAAIWLLSEVVALAFQMLRLRRLAGWSTWQVLGIGSAGI